jgi:long-chain-alcohol oxidase
MLHGMHAPLLVSEVTGTMQNVLQVECDVAVVGSDCGARERGAQVIEKGSYFTSRDYTGLEGPSMCQLYEAGEFVSTQILAGSMVGGGSTIN